MKVGTVTSWSILASLVAAVVVMFVWWNAASIPVSGSTTFLFMFATMGLWLSLFLVVHTLGKWFLPRGDVVGTSDGPDPAVRRMGSSPPN